MVQHYDFVVIGAGSGGLTAASFASQLGRKTMLIEKHRVGGDCTWTGCVPSKALLRAAKIAHHARTAKHYGIHAAPLKIDMAQVRDYVRTSISEIYQHETPEALIRQGIEVRLGAASFVDPHTLQVGDDQIRARHIVIATGARPTVPDIPGLSSVSYHTYETIFDNEHLPEHLIVIGTGPQGVEIAQAYRRLGAEVTLIGPRLLPLDEPEAAECLEATFAREGIKRLKALATDIRRSGRSITVHAGTESTSGTMLFIATGRVPNVNGLNLEAAGIAYSRDGIRVNSVLQTTQKHVYAVGDCTGGFQFTHYAGWQAFKATRNALIPFIKSSGVRESIPYATFTDPGVARAGLSELEARKRYGSRVRITMRHGHHIDRAVTDNEHANSLIKLVHLNNGRLLGATVIAPEAGEIITEFALAIELGLKPGQLSAAIHVYPTFSSASQLALADVTTAALFRSPGGKVLKWLISRT